MHATTNMTRKHHVILESLHTGPIYLPLALKKDSCQYSIASKLFRHSHMYSQLSCGKNQFLDIVVMLKTFVELML